MPAIETGDLLARVFHFRVALSRPPLTTNEVSDTAFWIRGVDWTIIKRLSHTERQRGAYFTLFEEEVSDIA